MAYFRGSGLRASTLQFAGEYQASRVLGLFDCQFFVGFLKYIASGKLNIEISKTNI